MTHSHRLMFLVASAAMLLTACPAANAQTADSQPATAPSAISDEAIQALIVSVRQLRKGDADAMEKALAMCWEMAKAHPDAPNVDVVHNLILFMSLKLMNTRKDDDARLRFNNAVEHILASNDDSRAKCVADFQRVLHIVTTKDDKLAAMIPGQKPDDDAETRDVRLLNEFVERHKDTPSAAMAYTEAAKLAAMVVTLNDLHTRYVAILKEKYEDDRDARYYLREIGQYSDVGKPFTATLTTLDGKTLTLPDDLKGKVLVIDFWATWCGPCVQSMPEVKQFYEAYKNKGVEVIGVSLDETKEAAEKFVTEKKYDWIQTYDPGCWLNPTAAKYAIKGIPAVIVVDQEGNIASFSHGIGSEERTTINKLLRNKPATKPAEK